MREEEHKRYIRERREVEKMVKYAKIWAVERLGFKLMRDLRKNLDFRERSNVRDIIECQHDSGNKL